MEYKHKFLVFAYTNFGGIMIRGDRLKELRKSKSMSQEDLAKTVGVSKSSISCYEKGTRTPSIETLIDFMVLFGVTSDYLIGSDKIIKIINDEDVELRVLSKEEIIFLDELRKNDMISNLILDDPKRVAGLIKTKIG